MVEGRHPRVSGAVMLDQFRALEELYGAEVMQQSLEPLSAEERVTIESLTPMSWLPVELVGRIIENAAHAVRETPSAVQERIVRVGVERALKTIWRVFLRITSDEAVVKRAPLLYSKTYDRGALSAELTAPGRARLLLSGWEDPPELELEGLAAGVKTFLECAGRRDIVVRFKREDGGAGFDVQWRS